MNSPVSYHLAVNGVQTGPHSAVEIERQIAAGSAHADSLCWQPAWGEWRSLARAFPASFPAGSIDPKLLSQAPSASAFIIENGFLKVPRNAPFPAVCIRTGTTEDLVDNPKRITLSWHHPAGYIPLLLNVLIYFIIALIIRKLSTHTVYLSQQAKAALLKWNLINWLLFLCMLGGIAVSISAETPAYAGVSVVMLFAIITIYFTKVRLLYAKRIDEKFASIGGMSPEVMQKIVDATR